MISAALTFDPLLAWGVLGAFGAVALGLVLFALWRGMPGLWLRLLSLAAVFAALANPSWQQEDRAALSDIALIVVDDSASQKLGERPAQTAAALEALQNRLKALPNTEVEVVRFADGEGDAGSLAMARVSEAMAEIPRARLAGVFLISDGQIHDAAQAPALPAPFHVLLTGAKSDWDRRLVIRTAPAFAIMGEPASVTFRIEDQGAVPAGRGGQAEVTIRVDAEPPATYLVPVGEEMELPVVLPHGGMNLLQIAVKAEPDELTDRNNAAVLRINGVRDRLRVLLVSGEPHAGERVWRNLLKSDASVDLVHFTILRPPEKQDGVPVSELSLIAFPTRELFVDKIDEFDLIIFDRYRRRGIMPMSYLESVRDYVRKGGAVLVAAGPEFGTADSLWRSPLAEILPVEPSSRVLEEGFRPKLTDLGRKHPVTAGMAKEADPETWGRWFRQLDLKAIGGQEVMSGIDGLPLLVLDRVGEGRVGMLASDHIWLWGRGYEGGGPQLELLRRLAHWTMKEPELEEETLTATTDKGILRIERRSLGEAVAPVIVTEPDGTRREVELKELRPGLWQGELPVETLGLYELVEGERRAVVALGPSAPREFEETIASALPLMPVTEATGGAAVSLIEGMPEIRRVAEGRATAGRGWLGISAREAYQTLDVRVRPMLPAWGWLLIAGLFVLTAWLREGRFASSARRG